MKIIALLFFATLTSYAFAQKTFTAKQEALEWLAESFSTNFIKAPVTINSNNRESSYDYKINETHLIIIIKTESESDKWVTVPYVNMSEIYSLQKNDYFKKITGIGFKPAFGDSYGVSFGKEYKKYEGENLYTIKAVFPFECKKDDIVISSLINAVNTIAKANKADTKIAGQKVDLIKQEADVKASYQNAIDLKIEGTFLKTYSLYNSENLSVNMHDFIEKNRRLKDKPTLVVTWSHTWCPPCLKKIDELLGKGIASEYNIIIVNKDGKTSYADIKSKMSTRKTDYFTHDILFLLDKDNQLEPLDKNSAPMFIWLDKNMAIKGIHHSHAISVSAISIMLESLSKK